MNECSFEASHFYGSLISFAQCSSIYHFLRNLAHISHDALLEQVHDECDDIIDGHLLNQDMSPTKEGLDSHIIS